MKKLRYKKNKLKHQEEKVDRKALEVEKRTAFEENVHYSRRPTIVEVEENSFEKKRKELVLELNKKFNSESTKPPSPI